MSESTVSTANSTDVETQSKNVVKAGGSAQPFDPTKIQKRLEPLTFGLNLEHVSVAAVVDKVVAGVYDDVKTSDIDQLIAETAAYMSQSHPDYSILASRIMVSRLHKETSET